MSENKAIIRRQTLRHNFVTDLSNAQVLIEIKHERNFRTAFGQIADYAISMDNTLWFKYILLFGDPRQWSTELWEDRCAICEAAGISLRWMIS